MNKKENEGSITEDLYHEVDGLSMCFTSDNWDHVQISIASENYILGISKGEIVKTDTLNYRTLKPERGGIFCPAIFGPTDEFKCECKRYVGESYKGLRCERCSVVVGSRRLRRLSFGHIRLNTVVMHPWFYFYACNLLMITKKIFMGIINFDYFCFVRDSEDGKHKRGKIVTSNQYYGELFMYDELMGGSEAILEMLRGVEIEKELSKINERIKGKKSSEVTDKDIRRRDILLMFYSSGSNIEDLAIKVLPCLPADLRPIFYLEGGGIATMDINDLYRKTISRNNRLQKLKDLETHRIIINNEKFMINQAIMQLMGPQKSNSNKSIAEYLKGKMGFIRRASLGKRGDYTGRGAIAVGPDLAIWECSIPLAIAMELFKPFIYSSMLRRRVAFSLIEAKKKVESRSSQAISILREIVNDFPIILNRAPTLHRLGIQGFTIKLTNSNAIRISPLVCTGYNADFDGDQMSVHLPISIAARVECYSLMLSSNNLFLPSNGGLILLPSKDIAAGLYYLSCLSEDKSFINTVIGNKMELLQLCESGFLNLNSEIKFFVNDVKGKRLVSTTAGRLKLWESVDTDKHHLVNFDLFNTLQDKNTINLMIMHVFKFVGWNATLHFLNKITKLGFEHITRSGISYSIDDMIQTDNKAEKIEEINSNIQKIRDHYVNGLITYEEFDAGVISEWSKYINSAGDEVIELLEKNPINFEDTNKVKGNNVYLMYISGARGSKSQIQQICCLRGFMAKPSGEISKLVISSSLKDGLNIFEYFESTHGERKGLSDVAIKTSRAGHFTRRLVDVAHSIYISKQDCGTDHYMEINKIGDKKKFAINFYDAIFGKVVAENIKHKSRIIIKKGTMIDEDVFNLIEKHYIGTVKVFSCIYCEAYEGVCAKCYGMDFSNYKAVDEGTPVGIIAAQSIGEPGTQLTMRTMHTGGIAKTEEQETAISTESSGVIDTSNLEFSINSKNEMVVLRDGKVYIKNAAGEVIEDIDIRSASILLKNHGEYIEMGDVVGYYNKNLRLIMAMDEGVVSYKDLIENISYAVNFDSETGITRKQTINTLRSYEDSIMPSICITDSEGGEHLYTLDVGMFIVVSEGQYVKRGDALSKMFSYKTKTHDITGGLPRIIDLFESKKSLSKAVIATHEGIIKITQGKGTKKTKQIAILDSETSKILNKFTVSNTRNLSVQDGLYVKKGSTIIDGEVYIQDIMDVLGFDYTIKYLIGEIAIIYEDQGVNISHKHFEVIIRQIVKFGIVTYAGDSKLHLLKVYPIQDIININKVLIAEKKAPCEYRNMVFGITRVALDYYNSFISSSSFQHTISILARAAISRSIDKMKGIKENLIFGKKIPVGTGYDKFIIDSQNKGQ